MVSEQTRTVRILMVDDNPANLRLLADMLISRGYEVYEASDGPTALTTVNAKHPDLIILDIFMPHMDGYEVCSRLKADEDTKNIPVIFISALSDADNIVRGFEVGGVDYITKPFKFREVLARIANHLTLVRQRQEIEALRQQDHQSFEALNRMKDEFIRMATHDLRNPLNVILGYLTVLDRLEVTETNIPLRTEVREAIQSNVQKMRQLVTDILDLAQVETGTGLTIAPVLLTPFLEKCLTSFYVIAGQRSITLTLVPPPQDLTVRIDTHYMTRVVDNLVANAIKYTPTGGQVTVSVQQEDGCAMLRIKDNGIGIPADDLPHLFNAFYRVTHEQKDEIEGSGLGLAIVKTIVGQHGGSIKVESEVGRGSTFSVALPLPSGG